MKNVFNAYGVTATDPTSVLSMYKFIELSAMIPTICENSVMDNEDLDETSYVVSEFVNDNVVCSPVVSSSLFL